MNLLVPPVVWGVSRRLVRFMRRPAVKRQLRGRTRLHLACGSNVLNGWGNIDLEGNGAVVRWNLVYPLPVKSGAIEVIFCEHFIEHITREEATALLAECHRILRPGGVLRLSTPSLEKTIDEYRAGRTSEWLDVGWSPASPCQMVNDAMRLWGHQFVYDATELRRILLDAGYREVIPARWRENAVPALRGLECRPFHGEIIMEATK